MKLKGLKELDHVHYYTASGEQRQINKQQVHKHGVEGSSRKELTNICTTTAADAEAAQTEQTHSRCPGSRALPKQHLLLLLLQAEHRAGGQGETLLSSESSSSAPAQN